MAARQHGSVQLFKPLLHAALLGWLWLNPAAAQETRPAAVIEELNAALLEVMTAADQLGYEGRFEQLAPVLEASYDFSFMARVASGTTWRDMSAQQQDELVGGLHDVQQGRVQLLDHRRRPILLGGRGRQQQPRRQRRLHQLLEQPYRSVLSICHTRSSRNRQS